MSAATTPDDATTTSPGLAVSTVIGMVLGVLGLFVLVVSYQFMPRKVKPSSPLRALAPPPPKPKPLLTRLRIRCTTLIKTFNRQLSSTPEHDDRQPGTHRPMRSFHLTPERRRQREAMRKKFASSLRLNITVDRPFKDIKAFASPRTPKNPYKRMKDDEESQLGLLKPDTAMISPWSATEDYFARTPPPLFTSSPLFTASPGPMSPPPAYDPNTPLRGSFNRDAARENTARDDLTVPPPSSSAADLERSPRDDVQSLIQEVQTVIEYTREWTRESTSDPFVVGELDSDDDASDTSNVWDAKL